MGHAPRRRVPPVCRKVSIMHTAQRRRRKGFLFLAVFAASIPAANWMIGDVGTTCLPGGPCLIPVAPGLAALERCPDGRHCPRHARPRPAPARPRLGRWRHPQRRRALVVGGPGRPRRRLRRRLPVLGGRRHGRLHAAAEARPRLGRIPLEHRRHRRRLRDPPSACFRRPVVLLGQAIGKGWMVLFAIPFIAALRRGDVRLGLDRTGVPA
jgi:queuosine precursor transporter